MCGTSMHENREAPCPPAGRSPGGPPRERERGSLG
jgi:hypothetical protein